MVEPKPKLVFSKRTRTRDGRTYYDNVHATSLEEAYELHGTSTFEGAEVDIIPAGPDDLERGERGLSYP
jgi:hypothetical protein